MYEHFRNDLVLELESHFTTKQIDLITQSLDKVAFNYEVSEKKTALAIYSDATQKVVQIYLSSLKLGGASDLTIKNYASRLRTFFRGIRKLPQDVQTNDVRLFLAKHQLVINISDTTMDKIRQILHGFFEWCKDEEYVAKNPVKPIKPIKCEKNKEVEALTRFQLERLRRMCKDSRDLAVVDVLFSTGVRVSELCRMNKSDIDYDTRSIHIIGKGKKHNTVYLNDNAIISLTAYFNDRDDDNDAMFVSTRKPHDRLSQRSIQAILKKYEKDLGVKRLSPHNMRHTMATTCIKAGVPLPTIQKMLGHSNVSTTQRYAKTDQSDVMLAHMKYVV